MRSRICDSLKISSLTFNFFTLIAGFARRGSPSPCFTSSQGSSQIDHIFVRQTQADMPAKGAGPRKWSLASWRNGGRRRSRLLCPHPGVSRTAHPLDLQGLRNACRDPSHAGIRAIRDSTAQFLAQSPAASVERVVPWQCPQVELSVKGMWQAYHQWRYRSCGLSYRLHRKVSGGGTAWTRCLAERSV